MTLEELERLENAKSLIAKIQKTKAQIKALESCTTVNISNSEKCGAEIPRADFNISIGHPFRNEAIVFIESFKYSLVTKLTALEKEFNDL